MARCGICTDEVEVRHIAVYIIGSEGLDVCHECEMLIVNYIRGLKQVVAKSKMLGVKIGRRSNVF